MFRFRESLYSPGVLRPFRPSCAILQSEGRYCLLEGEIPCSDCHIFLIEDFRFQSFELGSGCFVRGLTRIEDHIKDRGNRLWIKLPFSFRHDKDADLDAAQ